MSSDWIATDQDGEKIDLENLATQKWLEGQYVGVQVAVDRLSSVAAEHFRRGDDKLAHAMRDAATSLKSLIGELKKNADVHAKVHPFKIKERR